MAAGIERATAGWIGGRSAGRRAIVRGAAWPALLAGLALALFLPRLTTPPIYVFDEMYYAYTAAAYVEGDAAAYGWAIDPTDEAAFEWTHPPLSKLLIAGGIALFGDGPVGWRAASVLFGIGGVVLTFSLGRAVTGSRAVGLVAAGLLLADGLWFVESRLALPDVFLVVFTTGAALAFARVLAVPPARVGRPLLATGLLLGLALATKWSAAPLAGLIGLATVWRAGRLWREAGRVDSPATAAAARAGVRAYRRWTPAALVAVPAAVYLAAYGHFFALGYGWDDLVALHREMLAYHRQIGVVHDDVSRWWTWPLAARPVWYWGEAVGRERANVYANGNPLLYWPMVVAVGWVCIDWWGRRPAALTLLAIGFFGQWLPWALSPRGSFVYHFLPAVPFGCLALAVLVTDGWRAGGWRRSAAAGYAVAVAAAFAFFYPIYAAVPLSPGEIDLRMWWESWR